eukprot:144565_1
MSHSFKKAVDTRDVKYNENNDVPNASYNHTNYSHHPMYTNSVAVYQQQVYGNYQPMMSAKKHDTMSHSNHHSSHNTMSHSNHHSSHNTMYSSIAHQPQRPQPVAHTYHRNYPPYSSSHLGHEEYKTFAPNALQTSANPNPQPQCHSSQPLHEPIHPTFNRAVPSRHQYQSNTTATPHGPPFFTNTNALPHYTLNNTHQFPHQRPHVMHSPPPNHHTLVTNEMYMLHPPRMRNQPRSKTTDYPNSADKAMHGQEERKHGSVHEGNVTTNKSETDHLENKKQLNRICFCQKELQRSEKEWDSEWYCRCCCKSYSPEYKTFYACHSSIERCKYYEITGRKYIVCSGCYNSVGNAIEDEHRELVGVQKLQSTIAIIRKEIQICVNESNDKAREYMDFVYFLSYTHWLSKFKEVSLSQSRQDEYHKMLNLFDLFYKNTLQAISDQIDVADLQLKEGIFSNACNETTKQPIKVDAIALEWFTLKQEQSEQEQSADIELIEFDDWCSDCISKC